MVLIVKCGFGTMLSDKKGLQSHWKPIVKDRADCKVDVLFLFLNVLLYSSVQSNCKVRVLFLFWYICFYSG